MTRSDLHHGDEDVKQADGDQDDVNVEDEDDDVVGLVVSAATPMVQSKQCHVGTAARE